MKLHYKLSFLLFFMILFAGCGEETINSGLPDENKLNSAYLIDAPVSGIAYKTDTTKGITDIDGKFIYSKSDSWVSLSLGDVTIGKYDLANLNSDKQLFIGELAGSSRDDSTNPQVVLLLQFLQSLDSDHNPTNGITIDAGVARSLNGNTLNLRNSGVSENDIKGALNSIGKDLLPKEEAITYYEIYLNSIGYSIDTQAPIFLSKKKYRVNENQRSAFTVKVLDATQISYSLGGTDGGSFTIDNKGVVKFKVAADYETKKSYSLDVIAEDATGKRTTQNITVDINDLVEVTLKVPVLVVIMNWTDYRENSAKEWADKFFNKASDSVNRWFLETMNGGIEIEPVKESSGTKNDGIIMVEMGKKHPGGSNNRTFRDTEIKNAIQSATVVNNVDFDALDLDGNGILNTKELQIIFIVAGGEESFGDPQGHSIWAHQWSFSSNSGPKVDSVHVMQYSSNPDKAGTYARFGANHGDHQATIGIIAHEMGHSMLDLHDYYDNDTSGLGWYDIMSGGSWARKDGDNYAGETPTQYSAFNRIDSGFDMNVVETAATKKVTIECSSNDIVKLLTKKNNEYFLLACRDTAKADSDISLNYYDEDFTENRLFATLYHVDTAKDDNSEGGQQTANNHYKVAFVEKDTRVLMTASDNRAADFDDVYLVGDRVNSSKLKLYDGTETGYSINVLSEDTQDRTMTIKITKN